MTIAQALKKYHKTEIDLLLSHVLGKTKEFLFMNREIILSSYHLIILTKLVKRRLRGEPMAYILGYKDFYGLRFKVNRNVLIPRPETEELVNKVLSAKWLVLRRKIKILDLGTGSGCIIISLAKGLPSSRCTLYASDVSSNALTIAKQNAKIHKAKIRFLRSNLFSNIKGKFDIVIANLPYVPKRNYELGIKNLEYEPKIALVDSIKDFNLYERFFQQVGSHLNPNSSVYLEIDPAAKPLIAKWAKKYLPKGQVKFYRDFNNLWRYVEIGLLN